MKLNNHGLGLKYLILYSVIIIMAIFFIVVFSRQASDGFGDIFKESLKGNVTYTTIETNMSEKTLAYMKKYYKEEVGLGTITVTTDNLLKYQMLNEIDLITSEKDTCQGYALVKKNNGTLQAESFIKCNHYETKNYQSWRMGETNE